MVSSAADGASRDPRSHRFVPSAAHAIVVRKRLENKDGNLTVCQEGLEAFEKNAISRRWYRRGGVSACEYKGRRAFDFPSSAP